MERKYIKILVMMGLVILIITNVKAQEERIKSLFIYNFTKYIDWPADYKAGPFIIAVYGNTPVYNQLAESLAARKVSTQSIEVKNFNSVDEIQKCHIMYVAPSSTKNLGEIVNKVSGYSVLLITDSPGAINQSAINFTVVGGKQNYEVNTGYMKQKNLSFTTNLTSLAAKVVK